MGVGLLALLVAHGIKLVLQGPQDVEEHPAAHVNSKQETVSRVRNDAPGGHLLVQPVPVVAGQAHDMQQ